MGTTKRVPIRRHTRPQITPRAIDAYAQMKALKPQCSCPPDREPRHLPPCAACEEWGRLLMVVHVEMQARPWEIPCLDFEPPGPDADRWTVAAHARYRALEAALKASP
jgi:hypothetical protein